MTKVVFLSCKKIEGFYANDDKLRLYLESKGYVVDLKNWDDDVDWLQYEALIFRSTWDYFERESNFMEFLNKLEKLGVKTLNSIDIIKKNIHKFYLRDFENSGIKIIPTIFIDKGYNGILSNLIPPTWQTLVIKPAFSAGAYLTVKFDKKDIAFIQKEYSQYIINKDFLIQEYIPEIESKGEMSLIFFNKKYSHAIIKTPKEGDFRIQSQFGGIYRNHHPSQAIIDTASYIINGIKEDLLYARVDGIEINSEFYLMELELIEPDLYIQFDDESIKRFEEALATLLLK